MIQVSVENKKYQTPVGMQVFELLQQNGLKENHDKVIAIKINNQVAGLDTRLENDCEIELLTWKDEEGKATFWHSSAHLLAAAIEKLFPNAKFGIGPDIENGFYYDIDFGDYNFSDKDFSKVEKCMKKLASQSYVFSKECISKAEAIDFFQGRNNEYKVDLISDLQEGQITFYKSGNFTDLCKGPHLLNTGKIKAVKLLKVAGAYWRGDHTKPQLTRIYGISFPDKELLKEHLKMLDEAEKRDHRKLGKNLDLFSFHNFAQGFVFWHDKGMILKNQIINYWREEHQALGYEEVNTPILLNQNLWEQSGHWNLYKENMYTTTIDDVDFAIKPMNCPGGILLYKNKPRSYKELPLKMAELGLVHRHELSGVLHGLMRVRQFVQDDAHIYCTEKQLEDQIEEIIDLAMRMFTIFGFSDYRFSVSVRSIEKKDKYLGEDCTWELAESTLKKVLQKKELQYRVEEGEAKFYGPSIDLLIRDSIGREWQCSTIQVDFNLPKRFNLEYTTETGEKDTPIMLHRTVLGSLERFIGVLIEHYAGFFPVWLSPIQAIVLSVSEKTSDYAKNIMIELKKQKIRCIIDNSSATLNKKIRNSELQRIPYIIVVGDNEEISDTITIRQISNKSINTIKLSEFISQIRSQIKNRRNNI